MIYDLSIYSDVSRLSGHSGFGNPNLEIIKNVALINWVRMNFSTFSKRFIVFP